MFSHERAGAVVNKAGNHAVRGVEISMVQRFLIKELVSFLKFHDPTIFKFAPESDKDTYVTPDPNRRLLRRCKPCRLDDQDMALLQELYDQADVDRSMVDVVNAALEIDPTVMLHIVRDKWLDSSECLDTPKRCYKTLVSGQSYAP